MHANRCSKIEADVEMASFMRIAGTAAGGLDWAGPKTQHPALTIDLMETGKIVVVHSSRYKEA